MQPITYACVALVFFSCLTIAWAGALFEVVVPGLISAVFGGAVGGIFGAGNTFIAWVIVGIIVSGVIHFAYSIRFASQILMPVLACSIGTIISALIVSDLAKVRDVTVDTYSGKEFEYQVQGVNAISRIFLVGQRLYILIVINPESDGYETFVNSFKLMP